MKEIYLDYAATTPVHPEVRAAMLPYLGEEFGNPSSAHACGVRARQAVERAAAQVAGLINCRPEEVFFTSGGTESDNLALIGALRAAGNRNGRLVISAIEHHAVAETCRYLADHGYGCTVVPVNSKGLIDPDDIRRAITPDTVVVSVMHANNEIGTIQPLEEIGNITATAGVLLHSDAVQTAGRIPVDVDTLGVDLLALSSHKLYGPKGVGALYIRRGTRVAPLLHGGSQEKGMRAGTENVPGIVGLGAAAALARRDLTDEITRLQKLRDKLVAGIRGKIGDAVLNGDAALRLPNNVNFSFAGVESEAVVTMLDREGVCASGGSACTAGNLAVSHVLHAIGCPAELARGAVRFTLGRWTTEGHIDRVLEILPGIIDGLRTISPTYKPKPEEP